MPSVEITFSKLKKPSRLLTVVGHHNCLAEPDAARTGTFSKPRATGHLHSKAVNGRTFTGDNPSFRGKMHLTS